MLLEARELKKSYSRGEQRVEALRGLSLSIEAGQFVSIMGPSGSGKSTLLQLLGGLDRPSSGSILLEGKSIHALSDSDLSAVRRRRLGFVFQFFNILPTLSALENVALPLLIDGKSMSSIKDKAIALLELVGLTQRMHHHPHQLSGGEMQRVAIARALITDPALILADEPTGNLDTKTGARILEILGQIVREKGKTIVMVTHDPNAAAKGNRLIRLVDGALESDQKISAP